MPLSYVNNDGSLTTQGSAGVSSTKAEKNNNSMDKDAFLQLLVAQMKYQDPLEPSSNTDYIAQLATFSQVEELQNVSNSVTKAQASALVGKMVIVTTKTASGELTLQEGVVDCVVIENGKICLGINDGLYDIDDLYSVVDDEYYQRLMEEEAAQNNSSANNTDPSDDDPPSEGNPPSDNTTE